MVCPLVHSRARMLEQLRWIARCGTLTARFAMGRAHELLSNFELLLARFAVVAEDIIAEERDAASRALVPDLVMIVASAERRRGATALAGAVRRSGERGRGRGAAARAARFEVQLLL